MGGTGAIWRFRIFKIIPFRYQRWRPCQPSWKLSNYISSQTINQIELKLDGRQLRDSELLKSFCSDIQDGSQGGHLENLQTTSAIKQSVGLSSNLMGGIGMTWRFRFAKLVLFQYRRRPPWWPAWKSWNDICSLPISWIKLKLGGTHWGDNEIQNY